jgi:hypothetical protein
VWPDSWIFEKEGKRAPWCYTDSTNIWKGTDMEERCCRAFVLECSFISSHCHCSSFTIQLNPEIYFIARHLQYNWILKFIFRCLTDDPRGRFLEQYTDSVSMSTWWVKATKYSTRRSKDCT